MNHRHLSLVIALAALVLVAPGQPPPRHSLRNPLPMGGRRRRGELRMDAPTFRASGSNIATPLERPEGLAGRATLTDKEVSADEEGA